MINLQLTGYQDNAVLKFLENKRLLVALPPGTGKTVVALDAIQKVKKINPKIKILITVPANLRDNFVDNIVQFSLKIKASIITNVDELRNIKTSIVIVSYNFLNNHIEDFLSIDFKMLICDEFHYSKNLQSKNFQNLFKLSKNSEYVLGLTASPYSNTPLEFFTLISVIAADKSILNKWQNFVKYDYAVKPNLILRILFGKKYSGKFPAALTNINEFKRTFGQYLFIVSEKTLNKDVRFKNRPIPISKIIKIKISNYETNVYKYALKEIPKTLLRLLELNQISTHQLAEIKNQIMAVQQILLTPDYIKKNEIPKEPGTKMKFVAKQLKENGRKSLIFTPFLLRGAIVMNDLLNSMGVKSALYAGQIDKDERRKIVNRFEKGDLQAICMTTAGMEGINLPSCQDVWLLSLVWNPEVLNQVIGRALRITSSNKSINIYWVFALQNNGKDTIDEWMNEVLRRKQLFRDSIFKALGESMSVAGLTSYATYEPVGGKKDKNKILQTYYPNQER